MTKCKWRWTGSALGWSGPGRVVCFAVWGHAGVVPGGLGVVEGALALTLMGAGLRHPVALAAVLIYRAISFWVVISVGWLIYFLGPGRAIEDARERRPHACPGCQARWGTLTSACPCWWAPGPRKSPDRRTSEEKRARPDRQAAPARSGASGQPAEGPAERPPKRAPRTQTGGRPKEPIGTRRRRWPPGPPDGPRRCRKRLHARPARLVLARQAPGPARPAWARAVRERPHWSCRS